MFCDKLNPEDINQGNLGSCYFLSALIGLSNFEDRIKKLFVTNEVNQNGLYGVKILIQGEYQIIFVDDFIPCKPIERKPVFGTSSPKEIWLIILEKAWAKVNRGCYLRTWLGTPHEALTCLSEAPCIYEYHPKYIKRGNEISIWGNIVYSLNKEYIICTDTEDLEYPNEIGLVPFHAYTIIKAYDLTSLNLKLLKIRNPWGNNEWKGDYCKSSSKWTDELKKEIGSKDLNVKQGTFFINFENFIKYFTWTFYSKYHDNFYYCFSKFVINKSLDVSSSIISHHKVKTISTHLNNYINTSDFISAFIEVTNLTKCYICFHQPQNRFKEETDDYIIENNGLIPIGLLILVRYEPKNKNERKYTLISADSINWEKIYLDVTLKPGEYHIFCKSFIQFEKTLQFVISTYAEHPIEIYKLPENEIQKDWLSQILIEMAKENSKKEYFNIEEKSSYASNIIFENKNIGYGIFYYENNSRDGTLDVRISFKQKDGIDILNYEDIDINKNDNIYDLTIPPLESRAVFIQLKKLPWLCNTSWSHSFMYDYPSEKIACKYMKSKDTLEICIEKDLTVYTIRHNRGYLIMTENNSRYNYIGKFDFSNSNNFVIENFKLKEEKELDIIVSSRCKIYIKVKSMNISKDCILQFTNKFKII